MNKTVVLLLLCIVYVRTGGIKETDYEVLLSERAAKEIYLKWVDTLKVRYLTFKTDIIVLPLPLSLSALSLKQHRLYLASRVSTLPL